MMSILENLFRCKQAKGMDISSSISTKEHLSAGVFSYCEQKEL